MQTALHAPTADPSTELTGLALEINAELRGRGVTEAHYECVRAAAGRDPALALTVYGDRFGWDVLRIVDGYYLADMYCHKRRWKLRKTAVARLADHAQEAAERRQQHERQVERTREVAEAMARVENVRRDRMASFEFTVVDTDCRMRAMDDGIRVTMRSAHVHETIPVGPDDLDLVIESAVAKVAEECRAIIRAREEGRERIKRICEGTP